MIYSIYILFFNLSTNNNIEMKIPPIINISKLENYLDHNLSDTKVMLYTLIATDELNEISVSKKYMVYIFLRPILELCKRIMRYLSVIDPGYTPTLGQFMIEANKSQMALNKMDLDEERISRLEFLRKLKDGVQV